MVKTLEPTNINFEPLEEEKCNNTKEEVFSDVLEEDNDVRKAIPVKKDILINNSPEEEFEEFKRQILQDKTIDKDIKEIMIQSRKEIIFNYINSNKFNPEVASKSNLIIPLQKQLNLSFDSNTVKQIELKLKNGLMVISL